MAMMNGFEHTCINLWIQMSRQYFIDCFHVLWCRPSIQECMDRWKYWS